MPRAMPQTSAHLLAIRLRARWVAWRCRSCIALDPGFHGILEGGIWGIGQGSNDPCGQPRWIYTDECSLQHPDPNSTARWSMKVTSKDSLSMTTIDAMASITPCSKENYDVDASTMTCSDQQ